MKWYEENGNDSDVVVGSRIRLVRNLKDYCFPWKLKQEQASSLSEELSEKLIGVGALSGRTMESCKLNILSHTQRDALRERRVISRTAAKEPASARLLLSKDESVSILINCEDHLRIQVCSVSDLEQTWKEADRIDDYVNELYPYAFDEKIGYMTTFPTSIGTGMRVYKILHLPMLDSLDRFSELAGEVGRYGLKLKPAFSSDKQSNGNMYVLYNEKTLGISEVEILQLIDKVGSQLISQERTLRENSVKAHRLEAEDICYKAYGTIKYSRLLTMKMAMNLLSQLRWLQEMGLIELEKYCNFYGLMLEIQQAGLSLQGETSKKIREDQQRAEYLRSRLPRLRSEV